MEFTSDRALEVFLLPNQDIDSSHREVKKWRAGKMPTWKMIQGFSGKDIEQLNTGFAVINILHGILKLMKSVDSDEFGFDAESLFKTSPQLQALAKERASKSLLAS